MVDGGIDLRSSEFSEPFYCTRSPHTINPTMVTPIPTFTMHCRNIRSSVRISKRVCGLIGNIKVSELDSDSWRVENRTSLLDDRLAF
jgi:hypothetical protein